jgi:hypothetical protein
MLKAPSVCSLFTRKVITLPIYQREFSILRPCAKGGKGQVVLAHIVSLSDIIGRVRLSPPSFLLDVCRPHLAKHFNQSFIPKHPRGTRVYCIDWRERIAVLVQLYYPISPRIRQVRVSEGG